MIVWNSQTALPREPQSNPEYPGEFLYRHDDVTEEPPEFDVDTKLCQWDGSEWTISVKPITETINGVEVSRIGADSPITQRLTALEELRGLRQGILQEMEQYGKGLQDRPFTEAELDYRQELRDLPENSTPSLDENGELTGVTWPTKPE
jgi:hypothetical protein